jgi:hypothetical protein
VARRLRDYFIRSLAGQHAEIFEYAGIERISRSRCLQNARQLCAKYTVNLRHFEYAGLSPGTHKRICHFPKHTLDRATVDVRVCAVEVAERFIDAMAEGFANHPLVIRMSCSFQRQWRDPAQTAD